MILFKVICNVNTLKEKRINSCPVDISAWLKVPQSNSFEIAATLKGILLILQLGLIINTEFSYRLKIIQATQ